MLPLCLPQNTSSNCSKLSTARGCVTGQKVDPPTYLLYKNSTLGMDGLGLSADSCKNPLTPISGEWKNTT